MERKIAPERLPEGFIFLKDSHELQSDIELFNVLGLAGFPIAQQTGILKTKIQVVDVRKIPVFEEKLMPENLGLASMILEKVQMHLDPVPENLPPVNKIIFLDFHGVINCPMPEGETEIPDADSTIKHFVDMFSQLIELRQKGIGAIVLSFVGQMTNSHANLLGFCSQKLFQDIFIGLISVFEKTTKNKKTRWGKGKILHLFLQELNFQEKLLFVDDDPQNILDASLWLENSDSCTLIQFADPVLTAKANEKSNVKKCIKLTNFADLVDHFNNIKID